MKNAHHRCIHSAPGCGGLGCGGSFINHRIKRRNLIGRKRCDHHRHGRLVLIFGLSSENTHARAAGPMGHAQAALQRGGHVA